MTSDAPEVAAKAAVPFVVVITMVFPLTTSAVSSVALRAAESSRR
jgi:hypothetical protein